MNLWKRKDNKTYLTNILLVNMLILFVVMPVLVMSGNWLLDADEYSYVAAHTYTSYLTLAGGILFVILLLYAAYFEYIFLLLCSYSYSKRKYFSTYFILQSSLKKATAVFSTKILFFTFYFLLILPFSGTGYTSELLSKIKVPIFILDYVFKERHLFISLVVLFYLGLMYLGIRFSFTLPFMILQEVPLKKALHHSISLTKKYFWKLVGSFSAMILGALVFNFIIYACLLGIQWIFERNFSEASLYSATLLSTMAWFIRLITSILVIIGSVQIVLFFMNKERQLDGLKLQEFMHKKQHTLLEVCLLLICFFGLLAVRTRDNYMFMRQSTHKIPIVIAHRGVDGNNALQNSISALKKTNRSAKPHYTEMDIQETKDHKFVVSHDSNLKKLTGKNLIAQKLTLRQVTSLTAHEGKHSAKLVSFDKYLSEAHKIGQLLIVEIKVSKYDSEHMLDIFADRYGQSLIRHGDVVHSLDYRTVYRLKKKIPQLKVGYILPFNVLGVPKTVADFYSVEYSTLNDDFITEAQRQHKKVYTWTVNRSPSMYGDLSMEVDGIITDNGTKLNTTIDKYQSTRTYTYKMLALMLNLYR
ncbi:glycerophosphodiester phosphodiesterase [Liquorilactobacillus uvarum]|uniref:glycerophosphodiester phosphodiesterase n=1 Tax=Liquorilactobacillus uvarum TaxID=303240 RepID=UPI00288A82A7|nr:glycerophosphodiester phosphodiesterase [Liquorilactobacillus uvarum]